MWMVPRHKKCDQLKYKKYDLDMKNFIKIQNMLSRYERIGVWKKVTMVLNYEFCNIHNN